MSLSDGTKLGAYEITGQIGAGGMGEVYRATDTKLGRDVAIKTLPAALASDKDRLARFEREAKLLAALNHPHIAAVHSLDEHEGTLYLAMELVEGETLEEKLKPGALPVEDALRLALQIAEALEAAHEKGVVHRDLKPANVMVTKGDIVKVLDFGLAKAFSEDPNESNVAQSPALSVAMTQQGLVLGTAGYMSPEQASGQPTDQRADIWAFGVVLYEMLTGLPLFSGESIPHVLADVLKTEPNWNRLPANLHPLVRHVLECCLTKKLRNRYHSIADARVDIEKALSDPEGSALRSLGHRSPPLSVTRRAVIGVSLIALGAAIAAGGIWFRPASESEPLVATFSIQPPEGVNLDLTVWRIPFEISPTGRDLAFVGKSGATRRLYVRPLATRDADARAVPGTEGALSPFWSPDSEWVAFVSGGSLKRARVSGGAPIVETIVAGAGVVGTFAGSWGGNNQILLGGNVIASVSAEGGDVTTVLTLDQIPGAQDLRSPIFVGDSNNFLFVSRGSTVELYVGSSDGQILRPLMTFANEIGSTLRYVEGHVFYIDNGVLWARAFDQTALEFEGEAQRVLEGVALSPPATAPYSVSANGVLAYRTLPLTERAVFQWFDRDGLAQDIVGEPVYLDGFDLSPDGTQLAFGSVITSGTVQLWHHSIDQGSPRPLVRGMLETVPRFGSEGQNLIFTSLRDPSNVFSFYSIGLRDESQHMVLGSDINLLAQFWDELNDRIVYTTPTDGTDLWVMDLTDESIDRLPLNTASNEDFASLSPDGNLMAFTTDESGESQVWLATYPDGQRLEQVSRGFANEPCWNADGTELYYIGEDRVLIAVSVEAMESGAIEIGDRVPLFPLTDAIDVIAQSDPVRRVLACAPDGRFLVATRAPPENEPISVLIGWDEK